MAKVQKLCGSLKLDMKHILVIEWFSKTLTVGFRRKCGLFFKTFIPILFFSTGWSTVFYKSSLNVFFKKGYFFVGVP